jgi:Putative peptidoglycan binding domain
MKTVFCICALLVFSLALRVSADDKQKANKASPKAPQASVKSSGAKNGGGPGGSAGAHAAAAHNMGGGTQHNARENNVPEMAKAGRGEHGLNAHQGGQHNPNAQTPQHGLNAHQNGEHGLNAHQTAQHGLNANAGAKLQGEQKGKFPGNAPVRNGFARENHAAGHWRSGVHWRDYHTVYASYHRTWHDRGWWRSHYNRVVFVGGGYWSSYWYWDGGYWFPAWGYDPAYVSYTYDAPIYAYDNLPPDQVVVNIQEALQDEGYYTGEIDGQLGEQTRDAIAAYQRDHNLELTAAIDEATVQSLGLSSSEQS